MPKSQAKSRRMAGRNSPGPGSSASSQIDLPAVHGLNKAQPHPEEWTLPHEWNIEKREMFDNWKLDVQSQISNIAGNLTTSLKKHPRGDVTDWNYTDTVENTDVRKKIQEKERAAGTSLNYGLARVPVPDRY